MGSIAVQTTVGSPMSRLLAWSKTITGQFTSIISLTVFIITWELVVRINNINELLLPSPSVIGMELIEVSQKGLLWGPLGETMLALAIGLVGALITGVCIGIWVGTSNVADLISTPYLWALRATPRIAIAPLVMIWAGFGLKAKVLMVFLSVTVIVLLIVQEGVQTVDVTLLRVARSFGASHIDILTKVIVPFILPSIANAIRNGIGMGFVAVLVVEMFSAAGGIGSQIKRASASYDSPRMFAFIFVLVVSSLTLITLSRRFENYVSRWREEAYA